LEWVESLEGFHSADQVGVEVPQVPEESGDHESEVEGAAESFGVGLLLLDRNHAQATRALACRLERFDMDVAEDERLE